MLRAEWKAAHVTWRDFLVDILLSPQVAAASLILLGVVVTALVSLGIAPGNRASLEQTAADRMEHDRRQAALDRTYDVRAETFLKALTWLRELDALTDTSDFGNLGAIWKKRRLGETVQP